MVSQLFLGMSLLGAEWVLYFLILLSILSVSLILERIVFFRSSTRGMDEFRTRLRSSISNNRIDEAARLIQGRIQEHQGSPKDLESPMALALLNHLQSKNQKSSPEILEKIGDDAVIRARLHWEKNLASLATIGSNSPFIGLFGTVLGIIKAFHDLSQQIALGAQTVTAGIAEALIATAIGILVAIPAVVAFNLFQRRVKAAAAEAEALKSFLIGKLAE